LFEKPKEEKGRKRSKDQIRQNKEIPTFLMQPPQLLHNLNTSGLGKRPGSVRKDLVQGVLMATEGLDKLR